MGSRVYSKYLRSLQSYEFTSGNLNSNSSAPLNFLAIPQFLLHILFIIFPMVNFFSIVLLGCNKFRRNREHGSSFKNLVITVSSKDIYFGDRFYNFRNFTYLHINRRVELGVRLSIYRFLTLSDLIIYFIIITFILTWELLKSLKVFSCQISIREKFKFLYEVSAELSSGQFMIGRLIDRSLSNIFRGNDIRNIVLPFEGRNWEKRAFALAEKNSINSIGIIHSAITSCHKSVYDYHAISKHHSPSFVLTPGRYFTNSLILHGWPEEKVVSSCYLRGIERIEFSDSKKRLIFSLTGNFYSSAVILRRISLIDDRNNLVFIALNRRASSYRKLYKLAIRLGLRIWDNNLSANSVVLTSSTSHFLEQLHKGIKSLPFYASVFDCKPGFDLIEDPIRRLTLSVDDISSLDSFSIYELVSSSTYKLDPSEFFDLSADFSLAINGLLVT